MMLKKNVEMGYYSGGKFHPIRASHDYDYGLAGETAKKVSSRLHSAAQAMKKKNTKKNPSDEIVEIVEAQIAITPDGEIEILDLESAALEPATIELSESLELTDNPGGYHIVHIQPNVWGVFLKNWLLKKFRTRIGAELYLRQLKRNPNEPTGTATERVTTYWRTPKYKRGRQWLEDNIGQQRLFQYNPAKVSVQTIGKGKYGVFYNAQLVKEFTTKAAATKYLNSLQNKARKNPEAELSEAFAEHLYNLDNDTHDVIFADNDDDVIFADDDDLDEIFEAADLIENGVGSWLKDAAKRRFNRFRAGRALKQKLKYADRASRADARLKNLIGNPAWLVNTTNALVGLASVAQIKDHLEKQQRKTKSVNNRAKKTPRKNPHGDIYKEFTGLEPTQTTEMPVSHLAPEKLDKLGDLVEIRLTDGRKLQFNPKARKHKVWLTAANRRKMWIVGTRIAKPNPELADHQIEEIGEIDKIVYHAHKPIVGDDKPEYYIHELGEWSGNKPILAADKEGFPVIHGGNYSIESRGIVD